jgi:peroxiredoxin
MQKLSDKPMIGQSGVLAAAALLLFSILLSSAVYAQPPSPFAVDKFVGQKAADFKLKDISGKEVLLSSFKGKVVLLNFWATWCPPCKAELPAMSKLHERLKNRGFIVIAVSTDKRPDEPKAYIADNPVAFTVLLDNDLKVSRNLYKAFMLPTTFLIDRKGIIVEKYFGEQEWESPEMIKTIEGLL